MTLPLSVPIDLDEILTHSVEGAHIAGKILTNNFGRLRAEEVQNKSKFDFVTAVDKAAEKAIVDYLQQFYPQHAIHAEESGKNAKSSDFKWLIDPLDGTKNYIHSFPVYSVSIGLRYRNRIVAGVVYVPDQDELFTALIGRGAFLNGKPIHVSATTQMASCMIATGFPHATKQCIDMYLSCFKNLFLEVSAIRRPGSAAIDLAYTACGRFDGFWEFKLNPWDIGAGILLVQEAGGKVTDPLGGSRFFDTGDLVAGTPVIHERMIQILAPLCRDRLDW